MNRYRYVPQVGIEVLSPDGTVVATHTTRKAKSAFLAGLGKPMSKTASRKVEQQSRVQGGVGFSRSGRRA